MVSSIIRATAAGVGGLVVIWVIYSFTLAPLRRHQAELRRELAGLRQQIEATRPVMQEIKQAEQATAAARAELLRLYASVPASSSLVWFPNRMKQHFDQLGMADSATRLNTALTDSAMPGYERTYWAVDVPLPGTPADIHSLLTAIAALEQAEPIIKVIDVAIRKDDDTGRQTAVINVTALLKK